MAKNPHNFGVFAGGRSGGGGSGGLADGGGDDHDGGMEARVAKLEAAVEFIHRDVADIKTDIRGMKNVDIVGLRTNAERDFRVLFGALIFVALGLAGLMAKGFNWF